MDETIQEQKKFSEYEKQRQFMIEERKIYENFHNPLTINNGGGGGSKIKNNYLIDENGNFLVDENGNYFILI